MKTKIVYVLVSDSSDYYYEQTLISATSAKMWNPDAEIVVVVDDKTNATFDEKRKALFDVATRKIVVELPSDMNKKRRSRVLKTTLRERLDGDFLYIDSDTVICQPLADVDSFDFELGAVLDRHIRLQRVRDYQALAKVEALGGTFSDGDDYFNGGVFYVKDTERTHEFFKDWHKLYLHGLSVGMDFDQPSLLLCNQRHRLIHLMDGVYNCQIFLGGLPYLGDAKIIHAFNIFGYSSFFLFNDRQFFQKIKEQGKLLPEDMKCIEKPKKHFQGDYALFYGDKTGYSHSSLFHLYNECPMSFLMVEKLGAILLKFNRMLKQPFMQKKREPWIDIAKGMLIIGVVFFHMKTILIDSCHIVHPAFETLYNVHIAYTVFFMPAFFVLTGYCSNFSRPFKEFLLANAKGILVPMVVLNVIPCLLSFNIEALRYLVDWRSWIIGLSFWFLPSLFLTKLFFWCIVHTTDNVWHAFGIATLCFVVALLVSHFDIGVNYWYWKPSLAFVSFMQLGYYLRKCQLFVLVSTVGACVYLATFPIWYWLYRFSWPNIGLVVHCEWSEVLPYLIASVSGCLLVLRVAKWISVQPVLEYIGKASLVVYCSHWFIAQHLSKYLSWVFNPDSILKAVLFYMISVGMALVACCLFYSVLNTKLLKWTIGK